MIEIYGIGNLTKDPEGMTTTSGTQICKMNVAVNKMYTKDGERQVGFYTIIVWNKLAENCLKFLKKGSKIGFKGDPQVRSYDANDGTKKYVFEIVAYEIEFLSSAKATEPKENDKLEPIDDEGLPF